MPTRDQAQEILHALQSLPPDKIAQVYDYISFLKERYGEQGAIDESHAWSEQDIKDLVSTSLAHAERTI